MPPRRQPRTLFTRKALKLARAAVKTLSLARERPTAGHDHALLNAGHRLVRELSSRSWITELLSLHALLPISTAGHELLIQHG